MTEVDREPNKLSPDVHALACAHLRWLYRDGQREAKAIRNAVRNANPLTRDELLTLCDKVDNLVNELKLSRRALWREGFGGRVFYISIGCALGAVYATWLILGLG